MKRALRFTTKLNSSRYSKTIVFGFYDLFAFARKAVFSTPTVIGVHRLEIGNLYNLCYQAQEEDAPRVHVKGPLYGVHGKGPRNCNVQPRLVERGFGYGGELICPPQVQQSF